MMKWLVKKKSVDARDSPMDMITEDPLATLELGLEPKASPGLKGRGSATASHSSRRRRKVSSSNQIYSVSRTNPLFDGDTTISEYKSSSETSGYSSRDQRQENGNIHNGIRDVQDEELSTISSISSIRNSEARALESKAPYLNPDYVNRIIINKVELGKSHPSSASLSPIGEETEGDERSIEDDSIVTNSLLVMTSASAADVSSEQKDFDDEFPPYIEPMDSRRDKGDAQNVEQVIRELSEAVISSRNVLSLTRAMGNKSKSNSLSSNPYSYAEYKSYKNNERLSELFRIKEINGLQVVNLDEVPSMDPIASYHNNNIPFYINPRLGNRDIIYEEYKANNESGLSNILDVNLLNHQALWESYYGLQREIVIDGTNRARRKSVLEAAGNGPSRGFFSNNFVLESISQPPASLNSNGQPIYPTRSKTGHSKNSRSSKNAFYRLIKSLHNSSCFWKSFWIIVGFTVVLIATIATSIYVTKSIIQKNN